MSWQNHNRGISSRLQETKLSMYSCKRPKSKLDVMESLELRRTQVCLKMIFSSKFTSKDCSRTLTIRKQLTQKSQ